MLQVTFRTYSNYYSLFIRYSNFWQSFLHLTALLAVGLTFFAMSLSRGFLCPHSMVTRGSLVAQMAKNLLSMQETQVLSLGQEDLLEKSMATQFNILFLFMLMYGKTNTVL